MEWSGGGRNRGKEGLYVWFWRIEFGNHSLHERVVFCGIPLLGVDTEMETRVVLGYVTPKAGARGDPKAGARELPPRVRLCPKRWWPRSNLDTEASDGRKGLRDGESWKNDP